MVSRLDNDSDTTTPGWVPTTKPTASAGGSRTQGATGPAPQGRPDDRRARRPRWPVALAFVAYGILALFAYWPAWPGNPHRIPTCACGDLAQNAWFVNWIPYALGHGHNPFITSAIELPRGVNLAQQTMAPLLGLIASPVTVAFGPVAGLNFALWFAIAASASACFVMLRRWVPWTPAAFIGGLLYGFSPYLVGQSAGHLNLLFVACPPLILLTLDELFVRQHHSPHRAGIVLGLLAAAQFLVSEELFVSTAVIALIGLLVLAVANPSEIRRRMAHGLAGLAWAAAVGGVILAYPVFLYFAGPNHFVGSAHGSSALPADLLGLVVPTSNVRLAPAAWAAVGDRLVGADIVENGSYLGVPLLVVLLALAIRCWRTGVVRFAAAMAVVAWVLSLGPRLVVDTHQSSIPLPFGVLQHTPLLSSLIYARLTVFVDLFAALLLAVGLDRVRARWRTRATQRRRRSPAGHVRLNGALSVIRLLAGAVVAAVVVVPLLPRWPVVTVDPAVPAFFQTEAVRQIPSGSVVLTYPYPEYPNDQAMLWQAEASMRFRILGGYALVPGPNRLISSAPVPLDPPSVPHTLVTDDTGSPALDAAPNEPAATPSDVVTLLRRYKVETVVAQRSGVAPDRALALLAAGIGTQPTFEDGVYVWTHVQQRLTR
jgi:hypothetical protein